MTERVTARTFGLLLLCLATAVPYGLLVRLLSTETVFAIALYVAVFAAYLAWSWYVVERRPAYRHRFSPTALGLALGCCTVAVVLLGWVAPTAVALVHLGALVVVFGCWAIPFAALAHALTGSEYDDVAEFPSITILVPAYNEEGYVGRTVASLLEANYPAEKEIIVVDDGSTDGTHEEAGRYGAENVTVVSKDNGGKYSALNYGLLFAEGEVVVTVDADSIVETNALREIVAPLAADPAVGAVAGNVRAFNRDSFVTRCQAIEYVLSINLFRRVYDQFGAVPIVPGCLGAYRRAALEEVEAYDPHTLTEDFDTTMKVLARGYEVRFSEAVVYTEAPDTWRDLYRQRLRWYRGNVMTLRKHLFGSTPPGNRYVDRIHVPLAVITMLFTPVASWLVLGVIAYIVVTGGHTAILPILVTYTVLVVLLTALALGIEGESYWYLGYAPLFVLGYKHVNDLVMVKSIVDVVGGTDLDWTNVSRIDQRESTSTELPSEPASADLSSEPSSNRQGD
ncbi:glycosyltransferase family 2 protein [Natrinema marinum]|uniref:glycosyltransferase family 2 protein n=1 Tax=Natrinema marinum TaxID=2961598 RepID=UPI0020C8F9A5|nr:glycosyltransferase family 2 protein [Natrinema marinum]